MLRYFRIQTGIFTDTYFVAKKLGPSVGGYMCAHLFVTDFVWCEVKLMKLRLMLILVLKSVFK